MKTLNHLITQSPVRFLITTMFFSSLTYSFAQLPTAQEKENNYTWGCSVAINDANAQVGYMNDAGLTSGTWGSIFNSGNRKDNSLSLSITPKYFINENILVRFEFGWAKIDLKNFVTTTSSTSFTPTSNYQLTYDTLGQKAYRYVPGIEWVCYKKKNIGLYCGFLIPIIKYSDITRTQYTEQRNVSTDTLTYWNKQQVNIPGGFAVGTGSLLGFDIYFGKYISLGAEFSSALLYYKVGGEVTYESTGQSIPNPAFKEIDSYPDSYKGIKFSKILSSIHISISI